MCLNNDKYDFDMQGFRGNLIFWVTKEWWRQDFTGLFYFS